MKKLATMAFITLSVLLLTACSGQKSESQSSSNSSSSTEQSSSPQDQGMNLEQIAEGDYSSIVGTWKNNKGDKLEISTTTISRNGFPLDNLKVANGGISNGVLYISVDKVFGLTFLPKGVSMPYPDHVTNMKDLSDLSKDRIDLSQNVTDGSYAFYKSK